MLDLLLFEPHIVVMHEHQLNKLNFKAFKRLAKMNGYKLTLHSKAIMTKAQQEGNNQGRRSEGMALWIHNSVHENYFMEKKKECTVYHDFQNGPKI